MNESKKRKRKLLHQIGTAIARYRLVEENDRIMVAVSGGKDSLTLLHMLGELQKKAPVRFDFFAYTLNQGQPDFNPEPLKQHYLSLGIEHYIERHDTFSVTREKIPEGQPLCSLCSRFRRGVLYTEAKRLNANKIALGHHSDDAMETLLLNLFYTGRLASMPPKLLSDNGQNVVIRPLILTAEKDLAAFAEENRFPIITCGSCKINANLERARIKELLHRESQGNPLLKSSMRKALANVQPRHLWDTELMDFQNFKIQAAPGPDQTAETELF